MLKYLLIRASVNSKTAKDTEVVIIRVKRALLFCFVANQGQLEEQDWTGLDWTGLDWTGLDWTRIWTGLDFFFGGGGV